jgi:RNA polymerase sigma-70 factor (ECF subfamily)
MFMATDSEFDNLMTRLRQGDEAAAQRAFQLMVQRLIGQARRRLHNFPQRLVDPEDVAQSVMRSFFCGMAAGEFELYNWDDLWGLLSRITWRKCGHKIEHLFAKKRDLRREVSQPDDWHELDAIAGEPSPSQAAILAETVETLMRDLDERERRILSLRLQGHSVEEISVAVERTERTVGRLLQRVRKKLERMREAEDETP